MCRNIRVLHHFQPPTTPEEIRAAAEQYVRKVSGVTKPAKADAAEVARAVDAVTRATARLLDNLPERGLPRTREGERERARTRWMAREARILGGAKDATTRAPARRAPSVATKTTATRTTAKPQTTKTQATPQATKTQAATTTRRAATAKTSARTKPARESSAR
ncbi:MAG: DUF2277 domain-containing protein [Labilithrix sp.]|nr:DUF2277 domain-containing protein [Labilithrix sp.]